MYCESLGKWRIVFPHKGPGCQRHPTRPSTKSLGPEERGSGPCSAGRDESLRKGGSVTHRGERDRCFHDELPLGAPLPRPIRREAAACAAIVAVVVIGIVSVVVVLLLAVGTAQALGAEGSLQPRRRRRALPHQPFHLLWKKKKIGVSHV